MKFKIILPIIFAGVMTVGARADETADTLSDMYEMYETVGQFCDGISDRISQVSGISKVNTAVTATGTVAAGGALYAGIKKSQTDTEIDELTKKLCDLGGCNQKNIEQMSNEEFFNNIMPVLVRIIEIENLRNKIAEKQDESKRLGNWRTGLLAGTVGTNVASAIISGLNKDQSDLIQQVTACNAAVAKLRDAHNSALANGISPIENPIMQTFASTIKRCGTLNTDDVEKIEKRMTVVMGTSIAGAAIGAVGTGTSIAANTDAVRNDDTDAGKKKEKTLNTIANVAAGANVATGLVETGFNISLISLTKDLMRSAQECEGTL